jgi:Arginase family.
VRPEDLAFIGLRSTEGPENALIAKYGIKVFRVPEVRAQGIESIVEQVTQPNDGLRHDLCIV